MKNNATNSAFMKLCNRRLILNIVRKKVVSRAELARMTGLTRAAVTLIVDELIKDGIINEIGTAEANYGRKPVLLDLDPNSLYAVGVSITRYDCTIGIMNIKGELIEKRKVNISSSIDAYMNINAIMKDVQIMIEDSAVPVGKISGIGINTPGPVDIHTGTILAPPNFNIWHGVNIVSEFKKDYDLQVYLENNSASLALAEKNYGRGLEYQSFMLLVVDTGIGTGLIINDNLYRGVGGFGSELGHTSVDINGKPCSCGNRGCLEVFASIPSLLENVHRSDKTIKTWNELIDRALTGDETCRKAVENEALYLSAGIVNAMNILELEAVILTGDIQYKPELLLDLIRNKVESIAINRHIRKLPIMISSIVKDSEVISAASIVLEKYFMGDAGTHSSV
jgi:predicted NBD/HSP70 family sugar kinase